MLYATVFLSVRIPIAAKYPNARYFRYFVFYGIKACLLRAYPLDLQTPYVWLIRFFVHDKNVIVFLTKVGIPFFWWRFSTASMDPRFLEEDKVRALYFLRRTKRFFMRSC